MTTSVRVINEGPLQVRIMVKDGDSIAHIALIDSHYVSSTIALYGNRRIEVEEVQPTQGAQQHGR